VARKPKDRGGTGETEQPRIELPAVITKPSAPQISGGSSETAVESSAGSGGVPQDSIPPEPIRTLTLPYERARMLATMPQSKWSESTKAAFTGMVAALPSAIDALIHAGQRKSFALEGFEIVEVLVCFAFVIWLIVSLITSRIHQTSIEHLEELYPIRPKEPTK
jgi:hypothetical protein